MGDPNLMQEEAGEMTGKSGRSILLLSMVFAFICLLLGGGWRLVGGQKDDPVPVRPYASIRAALSSAEAAPVHSASLMRRASGMARMHVSPAQEYQNLKRLVLSDANGNVLAAGTYMRAVYQAFTLDDGFV